MLMASHYSETCGPSPRAGMRAQCQQVGPWNESTDVKAADLVPKLLLHICFFPPAIQCLYMCKIMLVGTPTQIQHMSCFWLLLHARSTSSIVTLVCCKIL